MSGRRSYIHDLKPHRIPISLADNTTIYSIGVGTMRFNARVNGVERLLEFQDVLYVPDLRSNLLSVLYLTRKKGLVVTIVHSTLFFRRSGALLFTASCNDGYSARLDGETVPFPETAQAVSTLPADASLWHRRFGHINHSAIDAMKSKGLVLGMTFDSQSRPDPIL